MPKPSAGILVYRRRGAGLEVLLVHPGGPFWARKDEGSWSLPKGEVDDPDDDPLAVARREFQEELGVAPPDTDEAIPLGEVRQAGGKRVVAWAMEGDVDVTDVRSNTFEMEWPPRSGRTRAFPEVDRAGWFGVDEARGKLLEGQRPFLERLAEVVATA
ncbi:MAG TPA: NUDIX domain-containing protein [Actinomycetota bacterium]|nr:NUDIX domain-containing protein [Actinomycetota bacterium]